MNIDFHNLVIVLKETDSELFAIFMGFETTCLAPRVSFFQSNVRQLGSLTKKVALPTIVCGLRPT